MLSMFMTMCKGGIIVPLLIYMCWRSMLPLSMSMCMCWSFFLGGGNVAAVHVHVYVLGGQCCLRTCRCVCY